MANLTTVEPKGLCVVDGQSKDGGLLDLILRPIT
jgi:hypothetical protein